MNGTDAPEYFDQALVKACVMDKPTEDVLWQYARENRCPRCNGQRLQPLGEIKTDRDPIGILVCRDCEFGIYVESVAASPDTTIDVEQMRHLLDRTQEVLDEDLQTELQKFCAVAAQSHNEKLQAENERLVDTVAHFGETLEAVQGGETFGDLVLRLLKERDRLQEALVFYARPEHWSEPVPDREIEQNGSNTHATLDAGWKARDAIGPQAIGMKAPVHPGLDIVKDKPAELVVAARILARALDKTVYLTKMRSPGVLDTSERPWTITIEKDGYGSEVAIEPDGSALECDVWC